MLPNPLLHLSRHATQLVTPFYIADDSIFQLYALFDHRRDNQPKEARDDQSHGEKGTEDAEDAEAHMTLVLVETYQWKQQISQ